MTVTKIRSATTADVATLVQLNSFVQRIHVAERPDYFLESRAEEVSAWFETMLASETAEIWIAERGDEPIGYALAIFRAREAHAFVRTRRWCDVDQIAIKPAARGQGIGRALVRTVIERAEATGIDNVELSTWSFNESARSSFEAMGFEPMVVRLELRR